MTFQSLFHQTRCYATLHVLQCKHTAIIAPNKFMLYKNAGKAMSPVQHMRIYYSIHGSLSSMIVIVMHLRVF